MAAQLQKLRKEKLIEMIEALEKSQGGDNSDLIEKIATLENQNQVLETRVENAEESQDNTEALQGNLEKKIQFRVTEGVYKRLMLFADGHGVSAEVMARDKVMKFLGFGEQYRA